MKDIVYFDIETAPLMTPVLERKLRDIKPPKNYKDADKIAAFVREENEAILERAALSPLTGQVAALTVLKHGEDKPFVKTLIQFSEADLIRSFWDMCPSASVGSFRLCGFNIHDFDIPFLVQRSWALGIKVPMELVGDGFSRHYMPFWLVDLRKVWGLSSPKPEGSLSDICLHLGFGPKIGNGKDFFPTLQTDPGKAIEYCVDEILKMRLVAQRLGIAQ